MPITKTMAYKVGDETYPTLESAQIAEITSALDKTPLEDIPSYIVNNKEAFVAILTVDPEDEKPARKPRSDKGKKRTKPDPNQLTAPDGSPAIPLRIKTAKDAAINRALQDGKQ